MIIDKGYRGIGVFMIIDIDIDIDISLVLFYLCYVSCGVVF